MTLDILSYAAAQKAQQRAADAETLRGNPLVRSEAFAATHPSPPTVGPFASGNTVPNANTVSGVLTGSATTTSESNVLTAVATAPWEKGMSITGTGIPAAATITDIGNGTLTISAKATASGTVTVTAGATAKPAFFRFFGGRPTYQSSFWQTTGRYLSSPAAWGVEFDFDGDQFDVQIQTAQNATWRLFVDGQPTGPTWTLYPHAIFFTGTVTGGTFTLTYGGQTTSAITYSTGLTAATVQAALEALSSIGAGNIKVAKISNTEFDVYFRGVAYPLTTMTSDITGLTGTTPGITISNPTGNTRYANVNFGAAARRRIRLEFAGSTVKFGGISREQTKYSVEKPSGRLGPKLVFFGDSFTIPTVTTGVPSASNTPTWDGYAHKAGKLLGYRDTEAIAQGGTGFFIAGTGSVFRARIQDVIDAQPDVFVLSGGHNDLGSGSATVQGVTDEGTYLLNAVKAARPACRLFVLGPLMSDSAASSITNQKTFEAGLRAACAATGATFITTMSVITGSGRTGAPINDGGNADRYVGNVTDTIHYSLEGHDFVGYYVAGRMAEYLPHVA